MLEYIASGLVVYTIIALVYAFYGDYLRSKEGFRNPETITSAKIIPGGNEEQSRLSPGIAMSTLSELPIQNGNLLPMSNDESLSNFSKMTSELCYRSDIGESLKKTGNFLQRTNNYKHSHPDDCSAPNHEMIGTFYTPFDGVGRYPESGTTIPITATCARN